MELEPLKILDAEVVAFGSWTKVYLKFKCHEPDKEDNVRVPSACVISFKMWKFLQRAVFQDPYD